MPGSAWGILPVPKLMLYRQRGWRLALVAPVALPTGDGNEMRGTDGVTVHPQVLLGWRSRFTWTLALGYKWLSQDAPPARRLTTRLRGGSPSPMRSCATSTSPPRSCGVQPERLRAGPVELPLEVIGGLIWRPAPGWSVYGGGALGITNGFGTRMARDPRRALRVGRRHHT